MPKPLQNLPPFLETENVGEESESVVKTERLGHFSGKEEDDQDSKFGMPTLFIGAGFLVILLILIFSGMIPAIWGMIKTLV